MAIYIVSKYFPTKYLLTTKGKKNNFIVTNLADTSSPKWSYHVNMTSQGIQPSQASWHNIISRYSCQRDTQLT